jgi:hypothetical protein
MMLRIAAVAAYCLLGGLLCGIVAAMIAKSIVIGLFGGLGGGLIFGILGFILVTCRGKKQNGGIQNSPASEIAQFPSPMNSPQKISPPPIVGISQAAFSGDSDDQNSKNPPPPIVGISQAAFSGDSDDQKITKRESSGKNRDQSLVKSEKVTSEEGNPKKEISVVQPQVLPQKGRGGGRGGRGGRGGDVSVQLKMQSQSDSLKSEIKQMPNSNVKDILQRKIQELGNSIPSTLLSVIRTVIDIKKHLEMPLDVANLLWEQSENPQKGISEALEALLAKDPFSSAKDQERLIYLNNAMISLGEINAAMSKWQNDFVIFKMEKIIPSASKSMPSPTSDDYPQFINLDAGDKKSLLTMPSHGALDGLLQCMYDAHKAVLKLEEIKNTKSNFSYATTNARTLMNKLLEEEIMLVEDDNLLSRNGKQMQFASAIKNYVKLLIGANDLAVKIGVIASKVELAASPLMEEYDNFFDTIIKSQEDFVKNDCVNMFLNEVAIVSKLNEITTNIITSLEEIEQKEKIPESSKVLQERYNELKTTLLSQIQEMMNMKISADFGEIAVEISNTGEAINDYPTAATISG